MPCLQRPLAFLATLEFEDEARETEEPTLFPVYASAMNMNARPGSHPGLPETHRDIAVQQSEFWNEHTYFSEASMPLPALTVKALLFLPETAN